jgi:hypothetical protein
VEKSVASGRVGRGCARLAALVARLWRLVRLERRSPAPVRAPVREPQPVLVGLLNFEPQRAAPRVRPRRRGHGDFVDAVEAQRFAALPPIEPGAVDDVDWDALADGLTRDV